MNFVAFLLACIEFVLVGFGVDFPVSSQIENLSFGLALVALGLCLPGAIALGHRGS